MKLCIAVAPGAPPGYPAIYKGDIFESAKKARDLGYSAVEWHLRRPDFAQVEQFSALCGRIGMGVAAIGTGLACVVDGLSLMHADDGIRAQAVTRLKEFIDMGEILGSAVILGSMKGKNPDGASHEAYLAENLRLVMDYAELKNVPVVIEVLNRYETNILNTVEQVEAFVRGFGSGLLKTHIDTFHMNIEEPDFAASIAACTTLGHVHVADSNRRYPGAGHIDFGAIFAALSGYHGWIGVECLPYPEPDVAAKRAIDHLSRLTD